MIVKMKKVTILCRAVDRDTTLDELQQIGVVHLSHVREPSGESLEDARHRLRDIKNAVSVLKGHPDVKTDAKGFDFSSLSPELFVERTLTTAKRIKDREEELGFWKRERERLEPFGDFDPSAVKALADRGIALKIYRAMHKQFDKIAGNFAIEEISRDKHLVYFAAVAEGEISILAEEIPIPDHTFSTVLRHISELETGIDQDRTELTELKKHIYSIQGYMDSTDDTVSFLEAQTGLGASGSLAYLRGYCPAGEVEKLRIAAGRYGWGLLVEDIGPEDNVPTKIENPRWVQPIKPVLQFIGVVPGYDEVDISTVFLLFFSLFFAMIVGDAGYGLIFLTLTYLGRRKYPDKPQLIFTLLYVMSIGTILWGVLTGQYFGITDLLPAPLEILKITWLTDQDNIMFLCFLIGAIHLTIAHGWNVIRYINTTLSLAHLGWIMTTWTMFFLARNMVIGHDFPSIMYYVLLAGVVLIVLFMTPVRRIKSEWFNHVMLPLNLVSNFVDVISYVRLFAVGMATYAVANAFNEIAVQIGFGNVVAGLGAALLLFFAHTLNILLAIMGVLVHGIRLNTLEFANHLGMQWTGKSYRPFSRKGIKADTEKVSGV
jgi:V/A-type H+/Na+-transporting ATPase subunit I